MFSGHEGYATLSTPLGWMTLAGTGTRLQRLKIGYRSERAAIQALADELGEGPRGRWTPEPQLSERLLRFAAGECVSFDEVQLDLDHLTPFQSRVVAECRAIGYGETLSYGELAARAGTPRAARAVGSVMRTNRFPLIVPCHRVLGAGGALGGFSAPEGVAFKRRLLELERAALVQHA